jgi:POT family proton-dependent oligopeptide transporter
MNSNAIKNQPELFGHPVGLYVLFFTEMWERFSYYGMRAILILYITAKTLSENPGLGWTDGEALKLYGWYTMLVYVASIPGGIIADKIIGQKKAVLWGGMILVAGHTILAVQQDWAFYTGLGLIIAGVGMLKPNISTMVGGLYPKGDERRDKGFTIFYIGINVGAFLSSLIVGFVGETIGWHYGFGLAGIGMLLGLLVYLWGQKYLEGVGEYIGDVKSPDNAMKDKPLTSIEKDRMLVLFLSFFLIIVFWGAFEQAGGLMSLYTKSNTDRNASLMTMNLLFILPILLILAKGGMAIAKKAASAKYWFILAAVVAAVFLLLKQYIFTTDPFEIPASVFQALNAGFIILFGTTVAGFWYNWKMKGREGSSLFKMAIGLIIMGWGFIFMRFASQEFNATGSSAMYWLVLAYLFHTIGELCASPVALSFITKLAPVKYASFMMGAYFAATGFGNKLAAWIGGAAQGAGELAIFTGLVGFCTVVGILVLALLKPLKRLTHGAEDLQLEAD